VGNAGSIVASLILNADPFEAGLKTGEESARRASGSIGASLDRINQKQLNKASTDILKTFVSPAALVVAGASIATDLISGFSTGKFKDWEQAGAALMESLRTGIQSIPIVGTFAKLGEAIGNAAFGVDKANQSLIETNRQIGITDTLVKGLRETNDFRVKSAQDVQDRINKIGKSGITIEYDAYRKSLEDRDKLNLENIANEFDASRKAIPEKIRSTTERVGHGASSHYKLIANPEFEKETNKRLAERAEYLAEQEQLLSGIRSEEMATMLEKLALEGRLTREQNEKIQGQKDAQALSNKAIADANTLLEINRRQANAEAEANAKFNQHMEDKLKADQLSLEMATQDHQMKVQDSATGVSSAIGNIKVAGAMDFSKSKDMEIAQKNLDSTIRSENELRSLNETLRKIGLTP
jgi:hypothetical protein